MNREYKNTTKYNRAIHDKDHPYLTVTSKLISDSNLSDEELGLIIRLLNNSDDYIFNSTYFQKHVSSQGDKKYFKSIKHLQELGYLIKKIKQGGVDWVINETPTGSAIDMQIDEAKSIIDDSCTTDINSTSPNVGSPEITTGESESLERKSLTNTKEISNNKTNTKEINNNEIINKELINILKFDDSLFDKLNTNNIGNDIIQNSGIDEFINKIKSVWNNSNSNKYNELNIIFYEIGDIIIKYLNGDEYEKLFNEDYEELPQFFITGNNLILSQLYLNLDKFLQDNRDKLEEQNNSFVTQKNNEEIPKEKKNNLGKKTRNRNLNYGNSNTIKTKYIKSNEEVKQYTSNSKVTENEYNEFHQLIERNRNLDKENRKEDLSQILKQFQEYFINVFGNEIWKLIKRDKTLQIKFINPSDFNMKIISLYQNSRDFYRKLMDEEVVIY